MILTFLDLLLLYISFPASASYGVGQIPQFPALGTNNVAGGLAFVFSSLFPFPFLVPDLAYESGSAEFLGVLGASHEW
jgi:hypothetical protein